MSNDEGQGSHAIPLLGHCQRWKFLDATFVIGLIAAVS